LSDGLIIKIVEVIETVPAKQGEVVFVKNGPPEDHQHIVLIIHYKKYSL